MKHVGYALRKITKCAVALGKHQDPILLVLDTAETDVIIDTSVTKLFLIFLINNDDLVLPLIGLSLELRSLCPE